MPYPVKICGLSEEATLHAAVDAGAALVGFVHFLKSPRHVSLARAAKLTSLLPPSVLSVLVLVDPDDELLDEITATAPMDYLQLHGNETPARLADIRKRYTQQKIIKAIALTTPADLRLARAYEHFADMLLFDAKAPVESSIPGGNGITFDWTLLAGFQSPLPWLLSGGLTPENVAEAIKQSGAKMVDVSSGVEQKPGVKDAGKINAFIEAARA